MLKALGAVEELHDEGHVGHVGGISGARTTSEDATDATKGIGNGVRGTLPNLVCPFQEDR
jgi:hypothetical protein